MPESIINEPDLALDRHDGNVFVLTMRKAPENRINSAYAQKLIAAYNKIRTIVGDDAEGAVITKGNDAKFWCTVGYTIPILYLCPNIQHTFWSPGVRSSCIDIDGFDMGSDATAQYDRSSIYITAQVRPRQPHTSSHHNSPSSTNPRSSRTPR